MDQEVIWIGLKWLIKWSTHSKILFHVISFSVFESKAVCVCVCVILHGSYRNTNRATQRDMWRTKINSLFIFFTEGWVLFSLCTRRRLRDYSNKMSCGISDALCVSCLLLYAFQKRKRVALSEGIGTRRKKKWKKQKTPCVLCFCFSSYFSETRVRTHTHTPAVH